MTLNGAIMQLVEMRENSMMPAVFKPFLDKVIGTISECVEPSEIIQCKDCKWKQGSECVRFAEVRPFPNDFCSRAERENE